MTALTSALKVLIIDDEPIDREIFKQYLDADRPGEFLYAEAATGREGLIRQKTFDPDCILLDLHLPDLDGLKMIRLLHEDRDMLPCAVVMLTGAGNEEVAVQAMKLGVTDYLAKGPASARSLARVVQSAIERFRYRREIAEHRLALEQRNLELEATRAELFDEKERYRIMAESIPQLVWTADSKGCIQYANQRLRDFSGDLDAKLECLFDADDRAELRNKWSEAVRSGRAFEIELRLRRSQDGAWRRQLMRTAQIPAADGGPARWFGTFTDIEDQKRAEVAFRQREKAAGIGLLAGGIAHDFNNLLTGIMGGASLVRDSLEPGHSAYPMIEIVLRSCERAAHLTQQLLAYAGKAEFYLEPVDFSRIVREACEPTRYSIPKNIRLRVETDNDIPVIETHAGYVRQVIANLVSNAVEAIGEKDGAITVRTAVKRVGPGISEAGEPQWNVLGYELPAGSYVLLEVSDSGPGMDDHMQTRIFDPFVTTRFMGRGLGLAEVQGIVRSLGGGIHVRSAAGRGSSFEILLPMRAVAAARNGNG